MSIGENGQASYSCDLCTTVRGYADWKTSRQYTARHITTRDHLDSIESMRLSEERKKRQEEMRRQLAEEASYPGTIRQGDISDVHVAPSRPRVEVVDYPMEDVWHEQDEVDGYTFGAGNTNLEEIVQSMYGRRKRQIIDKFGEERDDDDVTVSLVSRYLDQIGKKNISHIVRI